MTEQQVPKLAAALVEHQRHFAALPTKDAQWVIQNTAAAIDLFTNAVKNRGNNTAVATGALALLKTTKLGKVAGKKTRDCMSNTAHWYYRDSDIDHWLPAKQPAHTEGVISVYQMQKGMTFRETAAAVLQIGAGTSLDLLAKALKENGHVLTLPDIEQMVEKQESGEDVGLRTDGWANFAFVEDAVGSVSVARFRRDHGRWYVDVRRLGYDNRCYAENYLLLRNSVAPAL